MKKYIALSLFILITAACSGPKADKGAVVTLAYTLSCDGKIVEQTTAEKPFLFEMGDGTVIPGIEEAVRGRKRGAKISVQIPSDKAYGAHDPVLISSVPVSLLPKAQLVPGEVFTAETPDGRKLAATVLEISTATETAMVDFNHPLSGKTVNAEIKILGVKKK
ncbi:MAG: FKBP-type peptidyl-prolyl cis-trans isomerase [Elusimicrobiaceae bacterium]|jgi:FKBP-type peptidyl-prolyl cis-trans isomerase SlyD